MPRYYKTPEPERKAAQLGAIVLIVIVVLALTIGTML